MLYKMYIFVSIRSMSLLQMYEKELILDHTLRINTPISPKTPLKRHDYKTGKTKKIPHGINIPCGI